jgi:glycosyltransferase involved in cell wall biosynthesis
MRIAILSWESLHSIPVGGVAVHATELAAALERKGHEVHVFTRMAPGQRHYDCIYGVHYHRCPFHLNPSFVDEIQDFNRSLVHHVIDVENFIGPFDIVHAHDWLASNAMVWIKQGRGRKGVLTMHSTEYGRSGNHFYNGPSQRVRDHERHGTFCSDRVITVSNALKGEVTWMYELPDWKVRTIYNGVHARQYDGFIDPGAFRGHLGIGPMDPMVLFVGRLCIQKGPDLLVGSIPMLLHYYPGAKFVFVGDGEQRGPCEDLARRLRVSHATRFLGYRNGQYLIDLFKSADVVAVPSRNEPFGIVVLEAWSAGKPVVATQRGGPSEFVWHGVNGLKVFDHPESIAWGVGNIFKDFETARWMGRNGRVAAETAFTWDNIAEDTLGVYKSIN